MKEKTELAVSDPKLAHKKKLLDCFYLQNSNKNFPRLYKIFLLTVKFLKNLKIL